MKMHIVRHCLVAAALAFSSLAQAETYTVEFEWCAANQFQICAKVYGGGKPAIVQVSTSQKIGIQIAQMLRPYGRSLAMNVEAELRMIGTPDGRAQNVLLVESLEAKDEDTPRPRGR